MEGRKEGRLSRWTVFGLKQNPWTQLTLGLQLGKQGEEPAKDKKIQGLTLDLVVLTLDSGQSAFFCAHLQHPRLLVCRSVYQNPTFFYPRNTTGTGNFLMLCPAAYTMILQ